MNSKLKKYILLLILTCTMFLLAGCGAVVTTEMTINNDATNSGCRVMRATISKSTYDDYVSGTIEEVTQAIQEGCGDNLTFEMTEDEDNYIGVFTLTFNSIEDYKKQMLDVDEYYELTFIADETMFTQGLQFTENITSVDILDWVPQLLVDKGFVSSSNISNVFETGSGEVIYDGATYESYSSYTNVSDCTYYKIGYIDILTKINTDGTYDRQLIFNFPQQTLDSKPEIKEFMEARVPDGATAEWYIDDGGEYTLYTISLESVTASELETDMGKILNTSGIACHEDNTDSATDTSMLTYTSHLNETLDFTQYACDSYQTVAVNYFVSDKQVTTSLTINDSSYSPYDNGVYEGYLIGSSDRRTTMYVDYKAEVFYDIQNIDVVVKPETSDQVERTINISLSTSVNAHDLAYITNKIEQLLFYSGHEELCTTYSTEINGDTLIPTLIIKQSGTPTEITEELNLLLNSTGNSLKFAISSTGKSGKKTGAYSERISFTTLVNSNTQWDIPVTYTIQVKGAKLEDTSYGTGTLAKKDTYVIENTNGQISCELVVIKTDILSIVKWIVFGLAMIFLIAGLILLFTSEKFKKKPRAYVNGMQQPMMQQPMMQQPMMQQPMMQQPMMQQPMIQQPMMQQQTMQEPVQQPSVNANFCASCGAPLPEGAAFCEICGSSTKVEN